MSAGSTKKSNYDVQEQFEKNLYGLLEISNLVGSKQELGDILQRIAILSSQILDTPTCSIYLFGPQRQNLVLRAAAGVSEEAVGKRTLPIGIGLPGIAALENRLIAVDDVSKDPRNVNFSGKEKDEHHAYICSPLRMEYDVIGVMTMRRYRGRIFTDKDCTLIETICKQVAIVIEKSKMYYDKIEADRLAAISISLSEVAHYIKNLLQSTKGGTYFVDTGLKRGDLEMARKGWDVLQRGNRKITALVENMLSYSREMELELEDFNINAMIFEIVHQVDDMAVERQVALVPEASRNLPIIQIDYDRLYDALLNLVTNAIDAIPTDKTDGMVMVSTGYSEDCKYVEIRVKDNGMGMTEEQKSKIFNLFFSTKGNRGSGIGLSVTRKIVERHHGKILVETEKGKGSTFIIQLPVEWEESVEESLDSVTSENASRENS